MRSARTRQAGIAVAIWGRRAAWLALMAGGCVEASPGEGDSASDAGEQDASPMAWAPDATRESATAFGSDGGSSDEAGTDGGAQLDARTSPPIDASSQDAAQDGAALFGLPDFGDGTCPEGPAPNFSDGMGETCEAGEWELRADLVIDGETGSRPIECVQTADVPVDGAAFADFVAGNFPRGGFEGYATDDPPVFERHTTCAYGQGYYYTDTPIGGLLHLHWTYVAR